MAEVVSAGEGRSGHSLLAKALELGRSLLLRTERTESEAKVKTFRDHVSEITSRVEKIKLTREDFERYCLAVHEPSELHVNRVYAQNQGFEDVFAPGMQLASIGEQFTNDFVTGINHFVSSPFMITQLNLAFGKHLVYPYTGLTWICYDFELPENEGPIILHIIGAEKRNLKHLDLAKELTFQDKRAIKRSGTTLEVRLEHDLPPEDKHLYHPDHSQDYDPRKGLTDFLASIRRDSDKVVGMPWLYGASLFTNAIYSYFRKQGSRDKNTSGIHTASSLTFYARPAIDQELSVDLFLTPGGSRRMVEVVASQRHQPLMYGKVKFTPVGAKGLSTEGVEQK